jgi:PAS domain-containing protein
MVHDTTERKRAELALENSEKQLRFVLQGSG